jgi:hypothetical protein
MLALALADARSGSLPGTWAIGARGRLNTSGTMTPMSVPVIAPVSTSVK